MIHSRARTCAHHIPYTPLPILNHLLIYDLSESPAPLEQGKDRQLWLSLYIEMRSTTVLYLRVIDPVRNHNPIRHNRHDMEHRHMLGSQHTPDPNWVYAAEP